MNCSWLMWRLEAIGGGFRHTSAEHLQDFAAKLENTVKHVFVLKGGMGKKQRRTTAEALASVPEHEPRVILATGSCIGEGFDDARLDMLFLAMPISWKGTLQQYVGRLHRLHDNKRVVQVYDYVDNQVPMLARMFERRRYQCACRPRSRPPCLRSNVSSRRRVRGSFRRHSLMEPQYDAAHRNKYLQRHFNVKAPRLKKRFRNVFRVFVATHPLAKTS